MKRICIALLLSVAVAGVVAQTQVESKVWERVEALTKAVFEDKDSVALMDLVSKDVTYGHSSGVIEDKATMVHRAVINKASYKNRVFEKVSIDVKDNTAIVRHNFRATQVDEAGKESPLDLGILQVWKKENGKWRIWARQAVRIAPRS